MKKPAIAASTEVLSRAALIAFLLLAPIGCSFSKSSESISKSVSSPFTSMSKSSKSSSPEDAYKQDVRDVTAAHIKSGGTIEELRQEIGKQAESHGITNWEESEATYQGVGAGLAKAGYRQLEVDTFKKNFTTTSEQADWLQDGYDSAGD